MQHKLILVTLLISQTLYLVMASQPSQAQPMRERILERCQKAAQNQYGPVVEALIQKCLSKAPTDPQVPVPIPPAPSAPVLAQPAPPVGLPPAPPIPTDPSWIQ